jgi:hypothetical protein
MIEEDEVNENVVKPTTVQTSTSQPKDVKKSKEEKSSF